MQDDIKKTLLEILEKLIKPLDSQANHELLREGGQWRINIKSDKEKVFRDFKDRTLNSIQHLVRVLVHKKFPEDKTHFIIDINLTKLRRENTITKTIPTLANKEVISGGRPIAIIGLNGYERKLIHDSLSEVQGLETLSFGEKPNRRLVIRPTGETFSNLGFENARFITVDEIEQSEKSTAPQE